MADNQLRCWGLNGKAQLGLANTYSLGDYLEVFEVLPIDLGKGADGFASYAKTTATGAAHTCVVLGDGNVRCWGANESGQLGLGYKSMPPTDFVGGTTSSTPGKLDLVLVVHP
jgi:alpha-tubulin suppressor-like RCC1 family protein